MALMSERVEMLEGKVLQQHSAIMELECKAEMRKSGPLRPYISGRFGYGLGRPASKRQVRTPLVVRFWVFVSVVCASFLYFYRLFASGPTSGRYHSRRDDKQPELNRLQALFVEGDFNSNKAPGVERAADTSSRL